MRRSNDCGEKDHRNTCASEQGKRACLVLDCSALQCLFSAMAESVSRSIRIRIQCSQRPARHLASTTLTCSTNDTKAVRSREGCAGPTAAAKPNQLDLQILTSKAACWVLGVLRWRFRACSALRRAPAARFGWRCCRLHFGYTRLSVGVGKRLGLGLGSTLVRRRGHVAFERRFGRCELLAQAG
jgi:hypothetical protein